MEPTKEPKKGTGILRLKRAVAFAAVAVWLALMVAIFKSGGTMADQAPKCIFTTMIVFGILTAVYKGIEQWERKN
jgi:hypothetical protein